MRDTTRIDDVVDLEAALWLGDLALRRGDADGALRWYARGADAARALGDAHGLAEGLTWQAQVVLRRGQGARAVALLDSADRVLPRADSLGRATTACQRGYVLAFLARHREADSAARAGIALARGIGEYQLAAGCIASVGTLLAQRGEFFRADTALAQGIELLRHVAAPRQLGASLQWRGYVLHELTRLGEADSALTAAAAIAARIGDRNLAAWTAFNQGLLRQSVGDVERAAWYHEQAAAAFARSGDRWGEHSALSARSRLLVTLGELDQADSAARQVQRWARGAGNAWLQLYGWVNQSLVAEARGDYDQAYRLLDSALAATRAGRLVDPVLAVRYQQARVDLLRGRPDAAERGFREFLAGLDGAVPARQYTARARLAEARAAQGDVAAAARLLRDASDALDAWRDSLGQDALRRVAFATGFEDPDADLGVATVIAHVARQGDVGTALELAERRRARALVDALVRTAATGRDSVASRGVLAGGRRPLAELRAALPPDAAAVLFVTGRGREPSSAFVLSRDRLAWRELPPIDSLDVDIARLLALLAAGDDAPALRDRLGTLLVRPWLEALPPGTRQLVLVPDDVLHHLPFEALLVDGQALGARQRVSLAPSLTALSLLRARPAPPADRPLVAFADATALASDTALPPLPGARREALALARRIAGATAWVGPDATERRLRTDAATAGALHLATHAVVDPRSPLETFVALSPAEGDDGRLLAAEAGQLPLDAALVVLAACRTATGRVLLGEGVEGLVAPLIAAGARAVVASRWDVDDRAAVQLMERFYDGLVRGESAGEALDHATAAARERGAPVGTWAAFTLVGDPTVRVPLRARTSERRWVAPTLAALVLLLGWWGVARARAATAPR